MRPKRNRWVADDAERRRKRQKNRPGCTGPACAVSGARCPGSGGLGSPPSGAGRLYRPLASRSICCTPVPPSPSASSPTPDPTGSPPFPITGRTTIPGRNFVPNFPQPINRCARVLAGCVADQPQRVRPTRHALGERPNRGAQGGGTQDRLRKGAKGASEPLGRRVDAPANGEGVVERSATVADGESVTFRQGLPDVGLGALNRLR